MENNLSFAEFDRIRQLLADHGLEMQGSIEAKDGVLVVDIIDEEAFWLLANHYQVAVVNDDGFLSTIIDGVTYTTLDWELGLEACQKRIGVA